MRCFQSMIEHHCVDKKKWITRDEMMTVTVIAESTPGLIAINCATFTGYKKSGLLEISIIANAFKGIKIAVGLLILDAAVTMVKKMPKKKISAALMLCACVSMLLINIFAWNFSSIYLMIIGGLSLLLWQSFYRQLSLFYL